MIENERTTNSLGESSKIEAGAEIGNTEATITEVAADPNLIADLNTSSISYSVVTKERASEIKKAAQEWLDKHPSSAMAEGFGFPLRAPEPIEIGSDTHLAVPYSTPIDEGDSPLRPILSATISAAGTMLESIGESRVGKFLLKVGSLIVGEETAEEAKLRNIHPLLDSGLGIRRGKLPSNDN